MGEETRTCGYELEYKVTSQKIKWTGTYSPGHKQNNNPCEKLRAARIPKWVRSSQFTHGLPEANETSGLGQSRDTFWDWIIPSVVLAEEMERWAMIFPPTAKIYDNKVYIIWQVFEVKLW